MKIFLLQIRTKILNRYNIKQINFNINVENQSLRISHYVSLKKTNFILNPIHEIEVNSKSSANINQTL